MQFKFAFVQEKSSNVLQQMKDAGLKWPADTVYLFSWSYIVIVLCVVD